MYFWIRHMQPLWLFLYPLFVCVYGHFSKHSQGIKDTYTHHLKKTIFSDHTLKLSSRIENTDDVLRIWNNPPHPQQLLWCSVLLLWWLLHSCNSEMSLHNYRSALNQKKYTMLLQETKFKASIVAFLWINRAFLQMLRQTSEVYVRLIQDLNCCQQLKE